MDLVRLYEHFCRYGLHDPVDTPGSDAYELLAEPDPFGRGWSLTPLGVLYCEEQKLVEAGPALALRKEILRALKDGPLAWGELVALLRHPAGPLRAQTELLVWCRRIHYEKRRLRLQDGLLTFSELHAFTMQERTREQEAVAMLGGSGSLESSLRRKVQEAERLWNRGRYEEAREILRLCQRAAPGDARIRRILGRMERDDGEEFWDAFFPKPPRPWSSGPGQGKSFPSESSD